MNWLEDIDLTPVWAVLINIVMGPPIVRIGVVILAVLLFVLWWRRYR